MFLELRRAIVLEILYGRGQQNLTRMTWPKMPWCQSLHRFSIE